MDTKRAPMNSEECVNERIRAVVAYGKYKYGYPDQYLKDQKEYIKFVARLDGRSCAEIMVLVERGLSVIEEFIGTRPPQYSKITPPVLYYGTSLLLIASHANYRELLRKEIEYSGGSLYLGYILLRALCIARLEYLQNQSPRHQDARNFLYVAYIEYLEDYPEVRDKVLRDIKNTAKHISKRQTPEELLSLTWEESRKIFSGNLIEDIALTTSGDNGVNYIPRRIYLKLLDESTPASQIRKIKERLREKGIDEYEIEKRIQEEWRRAEHLQNPLPITSKGIAKIGESNFDKGISEEIIASLDSISDVSELHEIETMQPLIRWLGSIEDPLALEIARLRYAEGLTVREIADKTHIPKSSISDRLKKIGKPIV